MPRHSNSRQRSRPSHPAVAPGHADAPSTGCPRLAVRSHPQQKSGRYNHWAVRPHSLRCHPPTPPPTDSGLVSVKPMPPVPYRAAPMQPLALPCSADTPVGEWQRRKPATTQLLPPACICVCATPLPHPFFSMPAAWHRLRAHRKLVFQPAQHKRAPPPAYSRPCDFFCDCHASPARRYCPI